MGRMRRSRIVVGLGLALVLAACSDDSGGGGDDVADAPATSTSAPVEEREQAVFDFEIGDCFDDPDGVDLEQEGGDVLESVVSVGCDQAHDNEVIHLFEVDDATFPGQEVLQDRADEQCQARWPDYIGTAYADSELESFPLVPTAESWKRGDREIVCAVYLPDEKLVGSVRGAQR